MSSGSLPLFLGAWKLKVSWISAFRSTPSQLISEFKLHAPFGVGV